MTYQPSWATHEKFGEGKKAEYIALFRHSALLEQANLSDLEQLATLAIESYYRPNEFLLRPNQAEVNQALHFIKTGRVGVWKNNGQQVEELIKELTYGDYFGSLLLVNDPSLSESYQALTEVTSLDIGQQPFQQLIQPYLDLKAAHLQMQQSLNILEQLPILADLPLALLKQIASAGRRLLYPANMLLIQPGEQGKYFYFILSGKVDLWGTQSGPDGGSWQALRETGDFLGSPSLLNDLPADAVAITRETTEVIRLTGQDLQNLLQNLRLRQLLKRTARQLYSTGKQAG